MRFYLLLIVAMGSILLICKPASSRDQRSGINNVLNHNIFIVDLLWPDNQYLFNGQAVYSITQDNNIAASFSYIETPINYSEVTEVNICSGYKKYYSTKETNPDIYNLRLNSFTLTSYANGEIN